MTAAKTAKRRSARALFRVSLFAALICLFLGTLSCHVYLSNGLGGVLTVAGSTSVQPFAEKLAEEFMSKNPDKNINVQGGGSTAGIRAAQSGAAQIGMSSRHLKTQEGDLHQTIIAYDGIAVIVHHMNPLKELSRKMISDIFSGKIIRWEEIGGNPGEIHFVTREEGSGTRGAFEEMVMGDQDISAKALVQDSNGAVREIVAGDIKAIGYISLGLVDNRIKALAVDGVRPCRVEILAGRYAVVRPFLFLTKCEPGGASKRFVDFVLSSEGQTLLESEGLIHY